MSVVVSPNAPACTIYTMYVRRRFGNRVTLRASALREVIEGCSSIGIDTFVDYDNRTNYWRIYTRNRNLDIVLRCYGITVQRIEEDNIAPGLRLMAGSEVYKLAYRRARRSEVVQALASFIEGCLDRDDGRQWVDSLAEYKIDFVNGLTPAVEGRFHFLDIACRMNSRIGFVVAFCQTIVDRLPKKF